MATKVQSSICEEHAKIYPPHCVARGPLYKKKTKSDPFQVEEVSADKRTVERDCLSNVSSILKDTSHLQDEGSTFDLLQFQSGPGNDSRSIDAMLTTPAGSQEVAVQNAEANQPTS